MKGYSLLDIHVFGSHNECLYSHNCVDSLFPRNMQ